MSPRRQPSTLAAKSPLPPSPKTHRKVNGGVPPETVAVKVTFWPTRGLIGLKLKSGPERGASETDKGIIARPIGRFWMFPA